MTDDTRSKDITIHVHPEIAAATIGFIRGFFPSLILLLNQIGEQEGFRVSQDMIGEMTRVLDEIYDKCAADSDLREKAALVKEILAMTGGRWPSDKES